VSEVRIQPCPDGPVLVRGADRVVDDAGTEHPVTRPVVAVCVCGRSSRAPWCDGTHKAVRPRGVS
jgi:CDGSH-type Zn-finger protein